MKEMNKTFYFLWILFLSSFGAFLIVGGGKDNRGVSWHERHLPIIRGQLLELKRCLMEFEKKHGRYPDNNEGLAILDNFEARFKIHFNVPLNKDVTYIFAYNYDRFVWHRFKTNLKDYQETNHRFPKNEEEFRDTVRIGCDLEYSAESYYNVEMEVAIGKSCDFFWIYQGHILSPWFEPYVYENRSGYDKSVFSDSPANYDPNGLYSICVDQNVYVSTIGGKYHSAKLDKVWWQFYTPVILGFVTLAASIFLVILMAWSSLKLSCLGLLSIGISVVFVLFSSGRRATCYIMLPFFYCRNPEMVQQRRQLLDTYHSKGIINAETYHRALDALSLKPSREKEGKKR